MKLVEQTFEILEQEPGIEGIYKQIERASRTCYKSEDKITEDSAKKMVDNLIARKHFAMLEHGTIYMNGFCAKKFWEMPASMRRFINEPHSKFVQDLKDNGDIYYYITTNLRVLVEHNWLEYLDWHEDGLPKCEKRITVKLTTSRHVAQQLTRHRVFSYAMESQRFCNYSQGKFNCELDIIMPTWFQNASEWEQELFMSSCKNAEDTYLKLIELGQKPQQARVVLPNATKTELVMTGFISDWKKVFEERIDGTTGRPDDDIKALMTQVKDEFIKNKFDVIC